MPVWNLASHARKEHRSGETENRILKGAGTIGPIMAGVSNGFSTTLLYDSF
jgi:hypothetical protein